MESSSCGLPRPKRPAPTLVVEGGPTRGAPQLASFAPQIASTAPTSCCAAVGSENIATSSAAQSAAPPLAEPLEAESPYRCGLVARWFSAKPRLIVWDFDLTILRTHAFGEGVEVAEVAQRWESDVRDVDVFRAFVETAQEQGVALGIASYGRQEVIHEYMRQIFRQLEPPPFTEANIVTPSALKFPDGTSVPQGKPRMLELLCQRCSPNEVLDRANVLFFDDDPDNIADCRRAGYAHAFHTPEGFSRPALAQLEQRAGSARDGGTDGEQALPRPSSCAIG